MNASESNTPDSADKKMDRSTYEAPRIVWREPYEPVAFGTSCSKVVGNPACFPGPFTT